MAIADTARLIASLELQDKFSGPARNAEASLGRLEHKTVTLGQLGTSVGRGLTTVATNLAKIGAVGVGVIGVSVVQGLHVLERLEEVQTATNAVIKSTGGIAHVTAEEVRKLAEKYERLNATIDDKVIQSGENLLLTFTNINKEAFEPALEAALNLNEALGGGEEGLQGTIIQVGKALQDPIRGLTNLRRVGVNFSEAQKATIKQLVSENKLFEAQQIILGELGTEFGDRFVKAGTTATAKIAKFRDAVEDAQATLATAFLPVMVKAADKLQTFLSDPAVLKRISEFGNTLAGGFDDLVSFAGKLPWKSIGSAFEIAGIGAKAVLDAFRALPPWIQTAVLTGWGLNKLTGGALFGIPAELAKGFIKGILGMNAGVVNIKAGVVTGVGGAPTGGVPGVAGKAGSLLGNIAKLTLIATDVALVGAAVHLALETQTTADKGRETLLNTITRNAFSRSGIKQEIAKIDQTIAENSLNPIFRSQVLPTLEASKTFLQQQLAKSDEQLAAEKAIADKLDPIQKAAVEQARHAAQERADPAPKPLTAAELIAALAKTPVTGPTGRASILEQSTNPRRGQDAFGLSFLGILERTKPAILKTPEVMKEVTNHITELRDITKFYLNRGDTVSAGKTQTVIEKIEALIGVAKNPEDLAVRAEIKKMADDASRHAASDRADAAALKAKADAHTAQVRALIGSERADASVTQGRLSSLVAGWQAIHQAQAGQASILSQIRDKPWVNNNVNNVNVNVLTQATISVDTLTRTFVSSAYATSGRFGSGFKL